MARARARGHGRSEVALKDARGHEYEKGERVEDRKCASVRLMRAQARTRARRMASAEERFNAFPR